MLSPSQFRELISGERRGPGATALRGLLRAVEFPYTALVQRRNRRFDAAHTLIHRVGVPVVSVGNLTLGGTGKTPLVRWIVRWMQQQGIRPAIVSRGYAANDEGWNDEARELAQTLPDIPHVQDPDRVAAAQRAIEEYDCQAIVLDDGFQHRRLARAADIVLVDAREPFGFGHVFPRGTLREPLAGASRANVLVLTHSDSVSAAQRREIRAGFRHTAPQVPWCETRHAPVGLIDGQGNTEALSMAEGRRVAAFAGIGNPTGFQHTLTRLGCEVVAWREFPDHHPYSAADIGALTEWIESSGADLAVCTHKDLVKIGRTELRAVPLRAVEIDVDFTAGHDTLTAALRRACRA